MLADKMNWAAADLRRLGPHLTGANNEANAGGRLCWRIVSN